MAFLTQTFTNVNTNNQSETTASVDITAQSLVGWQILDKTGSHDNHVIAAQVSADNSNWKKLTRTLGSDMTEKYGDIPFGYIRFRVQIAEGATSTVDIIVNAK